jgi:putative ABC transport system substrate-binding protein
LAGSWDKISQLSIGGQTAIWRVFRRWRVVRLKPDLMLAGNNQAAIIMHRATAVIPIVAPTLFDPIGSGLVASLARPGGNVTGITNQDTLPEKNLELAAEAIRGAVKMGVLFNPEFQGHVIRRKTVEAAAATLAINLRRWRPGCPTILTRHSIRWHVNALIA